MAQHHGQPQGQQLLHEGHIVVVDGEFGELAAVAQHQLAQALQFGQREARCVRVAQDVGAVFVVVAVGDLRTDFVQLRGPSQLVFQPAGLALAHAGAHLAEQPAGHPAHPVGLYRVDTELAGQSLHRGGAHVGLDVLTVEQVIQGTVAQGAFGGAHLVDIEQIEHGAQHGQAATDHRAAVFFQAGHVQVRGAPCLQQAVEQPVQPVAGHGGGWAARQSQHVADGADGARGAVGHIPAAGPVGVERLVQHRLGGDLGHLERRWGELRVGEVPHGPGHAAHAVGLHDLRVETLAQDQLGGASADVHHEAALGGLWQRVRHALVDQPGFFAPGDDVDREAQDAFGLRQELGAVAGLAQGLGGNCAHVVLLEAGQPLAEARQAIPATLHGRRGEVAFFVQATALANGLFQVFGAVDLAVVEVADFKAVAVGSQVHSGEAGTVLHECLLVAGVSIAFTPGAAGGPGTGFSQ